MDALNRPSNLNELIEWVSEWLNGEINNWLIGQLIDWFYITFYVTADLYKM